MARSIQKPKAGPTLPEFDVPMKFARDLVKAMKTPTIRDEQVLIGPSGIGNPCEVCLARDMATSLPGHTYVPSKPSLASWMGSAVHNYMEQWMQTPEMQALFPGAVTEMTLPCGSIKGYGQIIGHTDWYWELIALCTDWKIVGPNTFKKAKVHGPEIKYKYQRQTYGKGIELAGLPIKYVMNFMILAGSTDFDIEIGKNIIVDVDHYRPEMADEAFARAETIWNDYVLTGRQNELESDPDCYVCSGVSSLFF